MAKRHRKYFVVIPNAQKFLSDAYGLNTKEINYYHLKVWHEEFDGTFNWYHTQGTVTVDTETYSGKVGHAKDDEELAILINQYITTKHHDKRI